MGVFEQLPYPGIQQGDTYKHDEILYSEHYPHVPKGCTMGPGQGVVLGGTLLARRDSDKMYYAYGGLGASDGLDRARGVLWWSVKLGDSPQNANILEAGFLKLEKIRGYDQQALEQLGAVIDEVRGTFKF